MAKYPIFDSPFFDVREWVDKRTWEYWGDARAASHVDRRIVRIADLFRKKIGMPVTMNNWHYARPGQRVFDARGFRAIWEPTGGDLSQHRCGRACDLVVDGMTSFAMHQIVLDHADEFLALGLTTMENAASTPGWIHLDCREIVGTWLLRAKPFLIVDP